MYLWKHFSLKHLLVLDFPDDSAGKESICSVGDLGSVPSLGKSSGGGKGYPLQYFGLKNPMDYIVHGVAKSQTRLSDLHSLQVPGVRTLYPSICSLHHLRKPSFQAWNFPLFGFWEIMKDFVEFWDLSVKRKDPL